MHFPDSKHPLPTRRFFCRRGRLREPGATRPIHRCTGDNYRKNKRQPTATTPCFTIDPEWRGRGIAGRLLRAAIEGLEAEGMVRMEAGPMAEPKTPADRFKGTVQLYRAAGYEEVADLPGGTRLMERKL